MSGERQGAERDALACCEHCEGAPTSRCWVADSIDGHAEPCVECASPDYDVLRLVDEDLLWEYLDEHLNANGAVPQVAGIDAEGIPFLAWLDEEGGDCVDLRVVRLLMDDGGTTSRPTPIEAPAQGYTSALVYPVHVAAPRPIPLASDPGAES